MKVVEVEKSDIINDFEDNIIIFNKETQSYFKKDASVNLDEQITFRDAIVNQYKKWARWREKVNGSDYLKYYDNNDEMKLFNVFNEIDKIAAKKEERILGFNTRTILDTIDSNILQSIKTTKMNIDAEYLNKFSKIIYVNQQIGNDNNLGTETEPVKTIRRAESLIVENTAIIIKPGVYDITTGNQNSDIKYCVSGLAGKENLTVEYINLDDINKVKLIVDTTTLDFEARDICFVNGIKNPNVKIIGITFKMMDNKKETSYGVSIARNSEGIEFIDCVIDIDVLNGNFVMNKKKNQNAIAFKNCLFDFKKKLTGPLFDTPYSGKYALENCYLNSEIKHKLDNYDLQNKNIRNEITLVSKINVSFFNKN